MSKRFLKIISTFSYTSTPINISLIENLHNYFFGTNKPVAMYNRLEMCAGVHCLQTRFDDLRKANPFDRLLYTTLIFICRPNGKVKFSNPFDIHRQTVDATMCSSLKKKRKIR